MTELRYQTAGESHGSGITILVEGIPFGLKWNQKLIDEFLARRQKGYGRSKRQQIEKDRAKVLGGLKKGITTGGPLAIWVGNKDDKIDRLAIPTTPRPGHADLVGCQKFETHDIRAVLERASARETVGRVAAGAIAAMFLKEFGVSSVGFVTAIGGVELSPEKVFKTLSSAKRNRDKSTLLTIDGGFEKKMRKRIDEVSQLGDSLGGVFEVWVEGLPPGLGSHVSADQRLGGRLAGALMGINAIKGVEIGLGFQAAGLPGSEVQDELATAQPKKKGVWGKYSRSSNNLGGLEGGMTTGQRVVLRAAMKPIPTLRKGLNSIDLKKKSNAKATYQRSDVCAVPAASVVGESVVLFELGRAFLQQYGGTSLTAIQRAYRSHQKVIQKQF